MIYAELAGGLGNQMFIYAFARALGLRCGEGVTLLDRQDWRDGAPAHTVCALGALNISPEVEILADSGFAKAHLPRQNTAKALMIKYEQRRGLLARDWHGFEAAAAPLLNALGLHFATDGYTPARRGKSKDFLAWGYFQSEKYFDDFADVVKTELRSKAVPAGECADRIRAAAWPVCVHLRRGDYQKPENAILQVCTPAYYARGSGAGESGPPRGRAVRVLGRYRLGAGASGHGGAARGVYAPGRGGGRPGADAALPWVCGEQLHIQLVGAIPG